MKIQTDPEITYFGKANFRNQDKKFGIKTDDRRRHTYVVGKTGMGKTALLENMAIQDIRRGDGMGFVDPHGEAAEELLDYVPEERMDDVIYFNPADLEFPIAFNIMEGVSQKHRHLLASGLMGVFKKIWPDVWSARMEYILNNAVLALLEYPDSTLLGVHKMLSDEEYREEVIDEIEDPVVKSFWVNEFSRYSERYEVKAVAAIQNKIGQLISAPLIRNIIGQVDTSIDIRKAMDEKKILIVNLSKGRIGEDASRLLGSMLVAKLQLAAMSRVDIPEEDREDFYLYVDEFQNFATESFVNILSEARKYRLDLILAHQYIAQMEEEVRDAVFGNMGTLISFRVGAEDAEYLEKEFVPEFDASDLVNLPKYNIYLKLMIDGVAGRPFSSTTLPPFDEPEETFTDEIIKKSQKKYGTKREKVEKKITEWSDLAAESAQSEHEEDQELYDVTCDRCGKETKVPFKPDPDRNVYCKSCLKKVNKEKEQEEEKQEEEKEEEEEEDYPSKMSLRKALEEQNSTFTKGEKKKTKKKKEDEDNNKEKSARDKVDTDSLKKLLEKSLEEDE